MQPCFCADWFLNVAVHNYRMPKKPSDAAKKAHDAMKRAEGLMREADSALFPTLNVIRTNGELLKTIKYGEKALEKNPGDHRSRFNLAKALFYAERDKEATEHFTELLKEEGYRKKVKDFLVKRGGMP